jgi:hypothetical protein
MKPAAIGTCASADKCTQFTSAEKRALVEYLKTF